jgi:hypothetical protein
MISSSGLRWDLEGVLLGSRGAKLVLVDDTGSSFSYRAADQHKFWQILLEVGGVLLIWLQGRDFLGHLSPSLRHAALVLFLLPVAHVTAKLFGHVTFTRVGSELRVKHFPHVYRNRRIAIDDIAGIQVNGEQDKEGSVSHYSLIVLGLGMKLDRLVHYLPEDSQASELAQRIEALIAPVRKGRAA